MKINRKSIKNYFQLLEVFTREELKSRYSSSILGPIWIVLYQLLSAALLNFIFGKFINIRTETPHYFLFVMSGLIYWNFFQQSINLAKDSLVWNRDLIIKTAFYKDTLPLSYIASKIPDFYISFGIFTFFAVYYGQHLTSSFLLLFILILPLVLFASSLGLIFSLTNAVFRDFGRIADFLMTVFFYASPIIYSEANIPQKYKFFLFINPLSLIIIISRRIIFRGQLDIYLLSLLFFISLVTFIAAFFLFRKYEKKIVDLI